MAKLRKMLGSADSPHILSLMALIETQSKKTLATWTISYAMEHLLGVYEQLNAGDERARETLTMGRRWLQGEVKLTDVKKAVTALNKVAKEHSEDPVSEACVRAISQAVAVISQPTATLSLVFYGSTALTYFEKGLKEDASTYEEHAKAICLKMEEALKAIAVQDELDCVKVNWYC